MGKQKKTIIVPIVINALCINKHNALSHEYKFSEIDYIGEDHIHAVPKVVLNTNENNTLKKPKPFYEWNYNHRKKGVYIHWELPQALRTGYANEKNDNEVKYPNVPNRWLVIRKTENNEIPSRYFYIISDAKIKDFNEEVNAKYVANDEAVQIGKLFSASNFDELTSKIENSKVNSSDINLKATSDFSPYFSAYQPYCNNVFSFRDDEAYLSNNTFSYSVVGWYDDPKNDICINEKDIASYLEKHNWIVNNNIEEITGLNSLYLGGIKGVAWNSERFYDTPDDFVGHSTVKLTVGNNYIDAFLSLTQDKAAPHEYKLAKSFLYGNINDLTTKKVASDYHIENSFKENWFKQQSDGFYWQFKKEDKTEASISNLDISILNKLNAIQKEFNSLLFKIANKSSTIDHNVVLKNELNKKYTELFGFIGNIDSTVSRLNLENETFKKIPRKPLLKAKDPSIILTNIGFKDHTPVGAFQNCMIREEVSTVNKNNLISKEILNLLDKDIITLNESKPNKDETEHYINFVSTWKEKEWFPLFLDYAIEAKVFPIDSWKFNVDTGAYILNSNNHIKKQFLETMFLTPSIGDLHKSKLKKLLKSPEHQNHSNTLTDEVIASKKFGFLSQALQNFRKHLNQHNADEKLIAGHQFVFSNVSVIDKFGRVRSIINDNNFETQDAITKVKYDFKESEINGEFSSNQKFTFELPPRINSFAKLDVITDTIVDSYLPINLIQGWVVVNSLGISSSLLIFNKTCAFLGELKIKGDTVIWENNTNNENFYPQKLNSNDTDYFLYSVVSKFLLDNSIKSFSSFVSNIQEAIKLMHDETATANDVYNIVGKPIALTKIDLKITTTDKVKTQEIPLKIGVQHNLEGNLTNDGLIGYFKTIHSNNKELNTDTFYVNDKPLSKKVFNNALNVTQVTKDSIAHIPIGNSRDNISSFFMLLNPLMSTHLHTGLLPVNELVFNPKEVLKKINKLEYYLKIEDLLLQEIVLNKNEDENKIYINIPTPNEIFGDWHWTEDGKAYEINDLTSEPNFKEKRMASGYLKLNKK